MKTRTNQTIAMLVVASMVALTTSQINTLSAGDIVLKKDESGYHSYLVSYKKEGTGICLTYTDASCVETVSYDLVDGEWIYNSTDLTPLGVSYTKLYKHTIQVDEDNNNSVIIISSRKEKYTSSNIVYLEDCVNIIVNDDNGGMSFIATSFNFTNGVYNVVNSSTSNQIVDYSFIDDEVEEL